MFKVTAVGNVVADGELRYTADGRGMFSFRIGVNSRRKDRSGEYEDHTDWIRVQTMRSTDYLSGACVKGATAVVVGTLQVDTYQGRDGDTRIALDVWADDIVIRGKPASTGDAAQRAGDHAAERAAAPMAAGAAGVASDLEDLPF